MGMTGSSYASGFESTYANPAGLGANGRMELMVGTSYGSYHLNIDGRGQDIDASHGMTIGFQLPLPFGGILEDVLTIGAGFFTPFAAILRNNVQFAEVPQWSVVDRAQVVALQIGFGINLERVVPGLRLGIGVSGLAQTTGTLDIFLDETDQFVSLTEAQLVTAFSPIVGVQYRRDEWGVGVTYRAELQSEIDLNIDVAIPGLPLPLLSIQALAQYDPHQLIAEGHWRPCPELMLVLNVTWRHWSAWPGPSGSTSERSNTPPAPDFRDTISPRVALEWQRRHERITLFGRGGFAFEPTPARAARMAPLRPFVQEGAEPPPPMLVPQRFIDSHRYILTAGFGLEWQTNNEPVFRLDIFAQMHRLQRRTHDIPAPGETENMKTDGIMWALGWTGGLGW